MVKKVYAIKEGFNSNTNEKIENIIVGTWAECLKYVKGVKGAKYKSFEDKNEAEKFLNGAPIILDKIDNNYPKDILHIYVDGSYNSQTMEYSYGMVAVRDDVVLHIESGKGNSDSTKNIRQIAGELEGAVKGCQYAQSMGEKKVVIFHDYIGICYHATGFWDRKEESSKQYYRKMQEIMKSGIEVIFVKVDSHTGDLFNELVDEKCKERLGIKSDKVVEKWLACNIINVASKAIKDEIRLIAPKGEANIIVKEPNTIKDSNIELKCNEKQNKTYSFSEIVHEYTINKGEIDSLLLNLSSDEKTNFIIYLLKTNDIK
ncbi:ribonuclease H1 domain-containing protein [Clostridium estertheticum]|uniref:ribonuclease H1 domain-containing protein n=1 Tax=Clostridium estertheticum TaxID=238834 RepID=UPI001C0C7E2C|nr:ribonuclease H family protein [Clostridium estertheticum]MBU3073270.1 ribonuclease H family protein [Clostridium estertheticum]MBU3163489.1 ribonuclease H family protein [Clostridium estertheticum]MBU3173226.1 ribonuclease H family protein [Clostridium estertheticum]